MIFTPRPYQVEAIAEGVQFFESADTNGAIEILPTGSGKSVVIANIAKQTTDPVLVLQPSKEILTQNHAKYTSYGYRAGIYSHSAGQKHIERVTFATIGSIIDKKYLFGDFKKVIVDECFPSGTIVDGKPIENIVVGDYVKSFNHDTGKIESKQVKRLFKKICDSDLLEIKLSDGTQFTCTDNHPIYTCEFGYIPAKVLSLCLNNKLTLLKEYFEPQEILQLQCMREGLPQKRTWKNRDLLQRCLYEGSNYEKASEPKYQMPYLSKTNCYNRISTFKLFKDWKGLLLKKLFSIGSIHRIYSRWAETSKNKRLEGSSLQKDEGGQPHEYARGERKNDRIIEGQNLSESGWKWATYPPANDITPCHGIANGISNRNGSGTTHIQVASKLLQSGFSGPDNQSGYRGGWEDTQVEEVEISRSAENGNIRGVGVESVKVYQRGDRQEFTKVCEDNCVYNIEVEDNHNYFVSNILVHNCHLVNSEEGMYNDFLRAEPGRKALGLSATPYRLTTDSDGAMLKFLTRTQPRIFTKVIYYIQNSTLFNAGHLSPMEYFDFNVIDRTKLEMNKAGTDFTDFSLREYSASINMPGVIIKRATQILKQRANLLTFCATVQDAYKVKNGMPHTAIVTGDTDGSTRDGVFKDFTTGRIPHLVNVGVATTGFDFPELQAVLLGKSTMSLALYEQMIGRVARPHKSKATGWVVDIGGNVRFFGKMETKEIVIDEYGQYSVWNNGRQLTNVSFTKN